MSTEPRPLIISLKRALREALATHEALRKLGYQSDNLYFVVSKPLVDPPQVRGMTQIGVALLHGGKRFDITVGFIRESSAVASTEWTKLIKRWNKSGNMTKAERTKLWRESWICRNKVNFVANLVLKGFHPRHNIM